MLLIPIMGCRGRRLFIQNHLTAISMDNISDIVVVYINCFATILGIYMDNTMHRN